MTSESLFPTHLELACSSNTQYSMNEGVTISYPQTPLPLPPAVQAQQAKHEISEMSVGSLLEKFSSELRIRIEPEVKDLIEKMTLAGGVESG